MENKKYRGFGKRVYEYIKTSSNKIIKNIEIATALKCDIRTIQRWTTRMEREGLLKRTQKNKYTPFEYYINH